MSEDKKRPVAKLREGRIEASIWKNEKDGKAMHTIEVTRPWPDQEGNFHESNRYSPSDLLNLARLAERSHDEVRDMKEKMRETAKSARARSRTRDRDRDQGYER